MKLICIKEFSETTLRRPHSSFFEVGKSYEYWTNFSGLNHIVMDDNGNKYPFSGPSDNQIRRHDGDDRPYVFDYFHTIGKIREEKLNELGI